MKNFKLAWTGLATNAVALTGASLMIVGCATGPKSAPATDDGAAKRSQVYMDKLDLVAVNGKLDSSKPCTVPPAAEKFNATQGPSKEWMTLVAHANTCVKEKNWKTLEALGNGIARIDIDSPWGAYFLSVAAEGQGEWQRAMWMIDLAQKKAGGRSALYSYQKGRIFYQLKETTRAMKEIEQATAQEPRLAEGHLFLAEIYQRDLENDKAMSHFAAVLQTDAKNFRALAGLGDLKMQAGAGEEAAAYLQRAVEAQPEQLQPWLKLATVYETMLKKSDLALNTYKSIKGAADAGKLREKPSIDLSAKIKALEEATRPRVPAQASTVTPDASKTIKKQ